MCYEPTAEVAASHRCFAERAGRSALPIALSSPTRNEGADQLAQRCGIWKCGCRRRRRSEPSKANRNFSRRFQGSRKMKDVHTTLRPREAARFLQRALNARHCTPHGGRMSRRGRRETSAGLIEGEDERRVPGICSKTGHAVI